MANRTIYIPDNDDPKWDEAQRLLPFYQHKSLSAFINEKVCEYVKEENSRQARQSVVTDLDKQELP